MEIRRGVQRLATGHQSQSHCNGDIIHRRLVMGIRTVSHFGCYRPHD